jgi:4-amino-4-deoxy-L-arabinose transferase-like glycosyltransferase
MFLKKHWAFILLLLIFGLALFLRVYKLGVLPATFHEDELLNGYLGRFILQNGKDLYGNFYPLLYFNKFGDYYIILPMYLSGIASYFFGVGEFATRFPAALFGALAVFPIYYLAYFIFNEKRVGLLAGFLFAITPWSIVLSRTTTEGVIGSTIFITGIVLLLASLKEINARYLLFSALLFFISYFIYHPFRLYTPLIFLPLFFLFRKMLLRHKKYAVLLAGITIAFFLLTFYISQTPWGKGRFEQASIFSPVSGVSIRIHEIMNDEGTNQRLLARVFHNKAIMYGREFMNQYLTYLSPRFLFVEWPLKIRYYIPEQGALFFAFLIFVGIAFIRLTKYKTNNSLLFYSLFLLFLAPIPAAFTFVESPNPHRSLFLLYILIIFIALGFYKSFFIKYKNIRLGYILCFLLALEFIYFSHQYVKHSDSYNDLYRNGPHKKVALYAIENEKKYDEIILPVEAGMPLYYLFFKKDFSPELVGKFRLDIRIDKTNNIRYIDNSCPTTIVQYEELKNKKALIIDRYDCLRSDRFKFIEEIKSSNALLSYKVYQY